MRPKIEKRSKAINRPRISDPTLINLKCEAISNAAMGVVTVLYESATTFRAATIAKHNTYQKLKPRLQHVIGAIIRELVLERHRNGPNAWVTISVSRVRSEDVGISQALFQNLLEGFEQGGYLERLSGYAGTLELTTPEPRRGRTTRVRGTQALFRLCAKHNITAHNVSMHLGPSKRSNDAVADASIIVKS
jgi:hypothetical protein